jgi:FkbM family methyltransferase
MRGSRREREYELRDSGLVARVRHPLLDMWAIEEIFRVGVYEPPAEADTALRGLGHPLRIADIGGHIGCFGLFMFARFDVRSIVSFEPDPDNAGQLRRCIEANGLTERWRVIEACAAGEDGTVEFDSSFHLSRVAEDDGELAVHQAHIGRSVPFLQGTALLEPRRVEVEARDAFPAMTDADLVKIDAEGAEWALLGDPRLAGLEARAVVLEYHPSYGPEEDADGAVRAALEAAGYRVGTPVPGDRAALVWAWKPAGSG